MKIIKFRPAKDKPVLQANVDIELPSGMQIRELSVFNAGGSGSRWLNFPSRTYELEGKKKYFQYIAFDEMKKRQEFEKEFFVVYDQYVEKNYPELVKKKAYVAPQQEQQETFF